jgi:serine/threonine protein kinase
MSGLEGLLAGRVLVKRYKIREVVGRGGFAVVYRADDLRLQRPVAVKVMTTNASDPATRANMRERFEREARAAAALPHHSSLVAIHDYGTDAELDIDFLAMELLRGQDLAR